MITGILIGILIGMFIEEKLTIYALEENNIEIKAETETRLRENAKKLEKLEKEKKKSNENYVRK
jgi:pyrimidine deaminase RibD-like protein